MAFNGAGVFVRLYNWVTDKGNSVPVTASRMDSEMDGFATGLSTCILKDGTQTITAAIPWNSQNLTGVGVLTVTGSTASTSSTTGTAIITGGLGVGGRGNFGGQLKVETTVTASSATTGAAVLAGGLGVALDVFSGGKFSATSQPGFSAYKAANQAGIASSVFTKVTFPSELFDIGSYYDTSTSRWTPPAGIVHIAAAVAYTGQNDNGTGYLAIYKNGSQHRTATISQSAAAAGEGITVSLIDRSNGTDYYEIFLLATTVSTITIDGTSGSLTYFSGTVL